MIKKYYDDLVAKDLALLKLKSSFGGMEIETNHPTLRRKMEKNVEQYNNKVDKTYNKLKGKGYSYASAMDKSGAAKKLPSAAVQNKSYEYWGLAVKNVRTAMKYTDFEPEQIVEKLKTKDDIFDKMSEIEIVSKVCKRLWKPNV